MGLCPSRNRSSLSNKVSKDPTILKAPPGLEPPKSTPNFSLRADADEFVPPPKPTLVPVPVEKEPWEEFLDLKQKEVASGARNSSSSNFLRKVDGTFTADYRRLLETEKTAPPRRYVPPQQRGNTMGKPDDLIREWKEVDFKPKKGYGTAPPRVEKKAGPKKPPVSVSGFEEADAKLRQALSKVKSGLAAKEALKDLEALEAMGAPQPAKDDTELAKGQLVPFGLTDYHYLSDSADSAKSHMHIGKVYRKPKDYARNQRITPDLEEAMTEVLFRLRSLRNAEAASGLEQSLGRRYCVGIREVGRALKEESVRSLKCVLVAPDVEQGGRTVRGSLDEKLAALLQNCKDQGIPVVYGLSRVRLGQAIKKSVTISVMGILDVRGMQQPFDKMLALAS